MRQAWIVALLLACSGDKDVSVTSTADTSPDDTGPAGDGWSLLGDGSALSAAVLSIWATSSGDVWMVGADDGTGPLLLSYDGTAWARIDTSSVPGDLWWIWSDGGETIFLSGEGGRVVTYSRTDGSLTEVTAANAAYKLFGLWGTSPTSVYGVGGDVNANLDGVIIHYDGTSWTEVATAPPGDTGSQRQAFKIWGSGEDNIWVVGTGALIMHHDGTGWTTDEAPPLYGSVPLTTVHGAGPGDVYAVGGLGNAATIHYDGTAWSDTSPPPLAVAPFFNGVYATTDRGVVSCGGSGSIWWHRDTEWVPDGRAQVTTRDLHACWIDETGAVWAVGGDLTTLDEGAVITDNPSVPPISF
ncbi:MAG TPA: hypothetical protein ENK18_21335 [Deltaproteobacteria bacterium]|nr:hypothetical protein [Deltaproteobacteria bacterium]